MQLTVLLLFLMGPCCVITSQLYEYHYINESQNWTEAQNYCRKKHTDLATVTNMTDVKRLPTVQNNTQAWIGLYSSTGINRTWHWSLPGVEFNESQITWSYKEPNDVGGPENCGFIRENRTLGDVSCEDNLGLFLCYNETNQNEPFYLIKERKKWLEALKYCRDHHADLVSGPKQLNDPKLNTDSTEFMLVGLFRDTWLWSDGSSFSFRNWEVGFTDWQERNKCAVVCKNSTWNSTECDEKKPFICYEDKVILVKQNKTWEEALEHCRQYHYELASITDLNQQRWIQDRAKQADTEHVWMGLRYTCTLGFWFWITDEVVSYKNWAPNGQRDECDMSGAMETKGQHKWISKPDGEMFNFICFKK
ncbi:C-type mannose receptor 2-like [Parambassis ranga]|uniref:C-type mannose receptor 2-like n=1 Tax=Parambassis ranga TaxID=210632 RepID=A0A6P7IML0_9TELE|nr:C-type mannose receptor 2-like [Parambassis ranga]